MRVSRLPIDQRGMGFVEILICLALMGFMSIAIAHMMTSANNSNRNITMTLEATSVTSLLGMLISDRNFCDANFVVNNVVDIDLDNLKDLKIPINKLAYPVVAGAPPPEVIFDRANIKPQGNSVVVADMFLSDIKSFNSALQVAKLNIVFDKGAVSAGPPIITRSLYMRLDTTVVAGKVVRVLHCGGSPPAEPVPTNGQNVPQQELDDKLFQNLLAGVKNTVFVHDKINLVKDMITSWQKMGLVSMDRYMTVAKYNALITDGGIIAPSDPRSGSLCDFFSTKIIDIANVPLIKSQITSGDDQQCMSKLAK